MRAALAIVLTLALAAPASAQHPYIKPDLTEHRSRAAWMPPVEYYATAEVQPPAPRFWHEPLFWAKVGSSAGVALASWYDGRASNRAIGEGRAKERNGWLRNDRGLVSGPKKALATGGAVAGSWGLYALGHRRLAILADAGVAVVFAILGRRAATINR